jgi:hypothetical protein
MPALPPKADFGPRRKYPLSAINGHSSPRRLVTDKTSVPLIHQKRHRRPYPLSAKSGLQALTRPPHRGCEKGGREGETQRLGSL